MNLNFIFDNVGQFQLEGIESAFEAREAIELYLEMRARISVVHLSGQTIPKIEVTSGASASVHLPADPDKGPNELEYQRIVGKNFRYTREEKMLSEGALPDPNGGSYPAKSRETIIGERLSVLRDNRTDITEGTASEAEHGEDDSDGDAF